MSNQQVKIFLSYHKSTPIYKSEVFQPIKVGKGELNDCISDSTGDNISYLNSYYCELTGQYWVLKNYIDNCSDKYIGFAHYRRLPDLTQISDIDEPSIWGLNYSESLELFDKLKNSNLYEYCKNYDVILPCSCYMYENTVNPTLRANKKNYNTYNHFQIEHGNNLPDKLKIVIDKYYPQYTKALNDCFKEEKSHFYNIYIMKIDLIKNYLNFIFDILDKIGKEIGGWEQTKYERMAGFVSEILINVWIKGNDLKIGYTPIYMIDFESEYIEHANTFHSLGLYEKELKELEKLIEITSDKFSVYCAILEANLKLNNDTKILKCIKNAENNAKTGYDRFNLASILRNYADKYKQEIYNNYIEAIKLCPDETLYTHSFLNFADKIHDIELTKIAWEYLSAQGLTSEESKKYQHFIKIYNMVNS